MNTIKYLKLVEYKRLCDNLITVRDNLIIRFLYETGCTVNELVQVRLKDIDFKNNIVHFSTKYTKNNHEKYSRISKKLSNYIRENVLDCDFLISTAKNTSLTTKRVRQIVQQLSTKYIFPITPQVLRYTHIAQAFFKNIPLKAIQNQVGMDNLRLIEIISEIDLTPNVNEYDRFFE